MDKLVRRTFLINDTPLYLERFKNKRIMLYEMSDNTLVEFMEGHYYSLRSDDNYILLDKIELGGFPNKLKGNPKKIIKKIRYYVDINPNLYAMIDYCNDYNIEPTIIVDFNSKEEADNFEVPSWFGPEILPKIKTKRIKNTNTLKIS